jgi:SNF2 family DNA or RNA helicase
VDVSGKLQLLQRLLPRLAARGHRVLIFSGFKMVLDVLEDFIRGLILPPLTNFSKSSGNDGTSSPPPPAYRPGHTLLYSRIDGSTDQRTRQRVIDAYNRPASKLFALLMTTRAGGQGLNLATADTVIIFDSDFNPHADRCVQLLYMPAIRRT